ncbi:MAG TPA: hypothetical protein VMW03_05925 [Candidatus Krumholzibacteriaceae bacterium]|nr:hypothetical protein [Candidatus Krumholzibacteriaceae bacterium]
MAKVGTSIRMKSDILRWVDEKVEESVFASRIHAFEYAVRQLMKSERRQRG